MCDQNSVVMKCCGAAGTSWPTNPVLSMWEDVFVWRTDENKRHIFMTSYVQRILKWWFRSGDSHQSRIISSKIMAIWFNYFDHICSSALRIWSRIWFLLSGSCLCKLVLRLHDQLKYYQREEAAIFYFLRVKCCLNSILMKHYRAAEMQCTSHHSHLSWIVFFIVSWCLKCTMW